MRADSPLQRYQRDLATAGFQPDPAQQRAVELLEAIFQRLVRGAPRRGLVGRFLRHTPWQPVRGAYLWGGVGRGKTYLMDGFYECLDFSAKRRLHFHRFMQEIHDRSRQLTQVEDPLRRIATDLAADTRVLCFDEFFVSDVADAMILGRLLTHLFEHGVCLVATSNIPPGELYRGGLQRDRFVPAIRLLQQHCEVLELAGDTDYRLRFLEAAEIFHHPLDAAAEQNLNTYFRQIAPDAAHADRSIRINGRDIALRKLADGIAWFDFESLCGGPRAAADYIELARLFGTILLSAVPELDWERENEARRFLHLVDELYDRRVKLIISAAVPLESLYRGDKLAFEFQRVVSRLKEMQSHEYLAAAHRP